MFDYFKNTRDFNYINALVFRNLSKLPNDIDLIIGIPRSGLIIATIISEFRHLPMTDLYSFINNIPIQKIATGSIAPEFDITLTKHILLVDDAVGHGISITNAKDILAKHTNAKITTYTVFTEDYGKNKVDIYCQILTEQFLPWSILKRSTPVSCVDIDGVLTEDVPNWANDDGPKYIDFLKNQKQLFIPDRPIHTLVSGRLEKYRTITENWLHSHNIQFKNLILLNLPNNIERNKINVGAYKADVYNKIGLPLFIESDINEALTIKSITKKPVFCTTICNLI